MRRVLLTAALLAGLARPAGAQRLVSPGPLAAAHARYDNMQSCLLCHDAGRELTRRKCLACHTTLASRIRAQSMILLQALYQREDAERGYVLMRASATGEELHMPLISVEMSVKQRHVQADERRVEGHRDSLRAHQDRGEHSTLRS